MQVKSGSWVVKQAVGSTPFIVGNKLNTTFHRGANYLETTIDINTNATAARITSYVAPLLTGMVLHLGFVLEGKSPDHLPEQLLGTVSLNNLDLKQAVHIDTSKPLSPPASAAADADTAEAAVSGGAAAEASAHGGTGEAGSASCALASGAHRSSGATASLHQRKISVADGETPLRDVLAQGIHSGNTPRRHTHSLSHADSDASTMTSRDRSQRSTAAEGQ